MRYRPVLWRYSLVWTKPSRAAAAQAGARLRGAPWPARPEGVPLKEPMALPHILDALASAAAISAHPGVVEIDAYGDRL